jgi:hypothetical protein
MKDGFVIDENFDMDYLDPDEFLDGLGLMFIFNLIICFKIGMNNKSLIIKLLGTIR